MQPKAQEIPANIWVTEPGDFYLFIFLPGARSNWQTHKLPMFTLINPTGNSTFTQMNHKIRVLDVAQIFLTFSDKINQGKWTSNQPEFGQNLRFLTGIVIWS